MRAFWLSGPAGCWHGASVAVALAGCFVGWGHGGGVWGGFWFSCWVMHCGWGLISIFQEFFGSIGKVFILVWGLGAARLSFYGI